MGTAAKGWALVLGSALALAGCVSMPIDEVPASLETLQALRQAQIPALGLGSFTTAKGLDPRSINIRGSTLHPAKGSSFAAFLGETFATELRAAGKLDPSAPLALSGELTESQAKENMARGTAALGATLTLSRGGKAVFSKPYRVETSWKSDFIGALAIPDAFRNYNGLYALLVRKALTDPEMIAAMKGG
ncbi:MULTISPECIES: hypothetical protein [unclassified Novosphingobium]|uniref:hypothetical protein n=1 Tax=unclassified Novosphingobium TaxID=2644732 RepID=UPI0025DEED46|nr:MULTISPECIES: hypothetical protein [unclassified Novosphingobium]HQV03024.1 hypothetical protein [Novosphingobium sp.]